MSSMTKYGAYWTNKKFGKKAQFDGSYGFNSDERVFVLKRIGPKKKKDNVKTYESHEAAKSFGWKRVKKTATAKRKAGAKR